MQRPTSILAATLLAGLALACSPVSGSNGRTGVAAEAVASDSFAELADDPRRLAELQRGCRSDSGGANAALCERAAEATRRRFQGGGAAYRPGPPPDLFPLPPDLDRDRKARSGLPASGQSSPARPN